MSFTPLTKKTEIRKAYGALANSLKSGASDAAGRWRGPERHREGRFFGTLHFLEHYTGQPEKIEWPDGVTMEVVVIGRIGGTLFLRSIGSYLHAVEDFKESV